MYDQFLFTVPELVHHSTQRIRIALRFVVAFALILHSTQPKCGVELGNSSHVVAVRHGPLVEHDQLMVFWHVSSTTQESLYDQYLLDRDTIVDVTDDTRCSTSSHQVCDQCSGDEESSVGRHLSCRALNEIKCDPINPIPKVPRRFRFQKTVTYNQCN